MMNVNELQKGDKIFVKDCDDNYAVGFVDHVGVDFIFVNVEDSEMVFEFTKENIVELEKIETKKEIGRPALGVTQKVSVTLTSEEWEKLNYLQLETESKSRSELFRTLVRKYLKEGDPE